MNLLKSFLERIHHFSDFIRLFGIKDYVFAAISPFIYLIGEYLCQVSDHYFGFIGAISHSLATIFLNIPAIDMFDLVSHVVKVCFGFLGTVIWWYYWRKTTQEKQRKLKLENDRLELDNQLLRQHIRIVKNTEEIKK